MTCEEFYQLVEGGRENRKLEFKSSGAWTDSGFREKVIASVLAMSSIQGGGYIIIGIRQVGDTVDLEGMKQEDFDTFNEEETKDKVSNYADSHVDFDLEKKVCEGKNLIVITVREFEEVPVICKRAGSILKKGAIYVRTKHRRPESAPVPDSNHMREIIDLAVDKKFIKEQKRLKKLGYEPTVTDEQKFEDQIKDLGI